ncbi:hypothetical protein J4409_01550 [Candidatus Woesearchaeota archaeon]|nr:hypothetical protein [Candidatus Woesearchaeota archaeon]
MKEKAQVWVSAILYLALGLVVIGLILGIAMPLVNKMRDRNTLIQTKTLMVNLNKNIFDVINEGPGSKRFLSPFTVEKGELYINSNPANSIYWKFTTKNKLMEPDILFREGDLKLNLTETTVVGEYYALLTLEYGRANLELNSDLANPFVGTYSITIENSGYNENERDPTVTISIKT